MNRRNTHQADGPTGVTATLPFHVVLVEPEIPQNTGNIGRTCIGLGADLHLVEPLGFAITDRQLKRAGLDYWPHLSWRKYPSYDDWQKQVQDSARVFYFSTKGQQLFYEQDFAPGDWFVFGKETKGLDPRILQRNKERCLRIPVAGPIRGYNLATAVAMVLSEAYRQCSTRT
ncbi:MAG: tRNA (uridine(34)/cytosine(34)/5-carboxymethylaminomethyluridine(34)-2'-O)-methyltransferase TrmL [Bdellovibrio sp.]|nr:MAG: tRNA (uridine(34)/cytosine(34)/5-carboxymethylaminomethyluridine(34)-2'-O)-methyltransferase TrmL [Bdellovibrio sp.]